MATDKRRYQVSVSDRMYNEVKRFKEENNYATWSEAIQELMRIGLQHLLEEEKERNK